ncbi:MAG: hypothetical protein AAB794_03870 [Patescibacteria group bacterium]
MTIAEVREKCKGAIAKVPRDIFIITVLVLASSASFVLGYFTGLDAGQGSTMILETNPLSVSPATTTISGQVVASKNGSKYYFPGCTGINRISEANKIWFVSAAAATAAGYSLATNCKGI